MKINPPGVQRASVGRSRRLRWRQVGLRRSFDRAAVGSVEIALVWRDLVWRPVGLVVVALAGDDLVGLLARLDHVAAELVEVRGLRARGVGILVFGAFGLGHR